MNKIYSFELPASPSHGQFPLAKFWCQLLANCQVMFATSHLWCSLPWWIHCPLACSVAKESQRTFHLCGERFSFVDWTTKSSFIRRSANFGNVSPFSSTSRSNKHIFRAYPFTLKIAELCFETTAANSTIIWSARLGFLPLREAGTGFVGVLPLRSTHVWSSRKHYIVHGNNAPASPALRIRACEAHELALTLLLPYSKPILEKNRLFCSLKSERHWQ